MSSDTETIDKRKFLCDCGYRTTTSFNLKRHQKTHLNDKSKPRVSIEAETEPEPEIEQLIKRLPSPPPPKRKSKRPPPIQRTLSEETVDDSDNEQETVSVMDYVDYRIEQALSEKSDYKQHHAEKRFSGGSSMMSGTVPSVLFGVAISYLAMSNMGVISSLLGGIVQKKTMSPEVLQMLRTQQRPIVSNSGEEKLSL